MSDFVMWGGFNLFVLLLLAFDLGVLHRKDRDMSVAEALWMSLAYFVLAMLFGGGIFMFMGEQKGLEFLTGYLIEKSLSVDNIFVFVLVFTHFSVPRHLQYRVLFWGILGALLMRGAMIGAGAVLIAQFHWVIYIFGAFLVITGIRMAMGGNEEIEPEANPVIRLVRRIIPIPTRFHGEHFFVRESLTPGGAVRLMATPLFVVLVLVETTDVVFAVDSIPAIFGVTRNPFLVYTSNVFAILGLRSMYFVLANVITKFHLLKYGLSVVLVFVGVKMLVSEIRPIGIGVSLGVVAAVLIGSVLLSLVIPPKARS